MPEINTSSKTVILLSSHFGGGAETAMQQLYVSQKGEFHNLEIWGINSEELNSSEGRFTFDRNKSGGLGHNLKILLDFKRKCRAENVGTIILNCDLPELFGAFTHRKTKLIVVEQSTHPWMGRRLLGRFVRSILVLKKSTWVKIFQDQKIWSNFGQKALLGPNLIASNSAESISRGPLDGLKRMVFLGRFHFQKRPEWIIQLGADSGVPVMMIGDGELKQYLLNLADELDADVEFTGFLPNPWERFRKGDVLVLTSRFEGKPLVIEEALIRGLPVLAMNLYGLTHEYRDCPVYFADSYSHLLDLINNFTSQSNTTDFRSDFPKIIKKNNELKIQLWTEIIKSVAN